MPRPNKLILCVGDEPKGLSVRKFMLETQGFRVMALRSTETALEKLAGRAGQSVHLLLVEVKPGGPNGQDLIRRARMLRPGVPTLLISGARTEERWEEVDGCVVGSVCCAAEVLDRVRALVARRPGPRRRAVLVPFPPADVLERTEGCEERAQA